MATNPKPCTVTITPNTDPPTVGCNPNPVPVTKGTNDGVVWTMATNDYVFTGVTIDGTTIRPGDPASGDFSGVSITDKTEGDGDGNGDDDKNKRSVMTVNDSLAEITGSVHEQSDHTYTVLYQARTGGATYSFDPTIRNQN